MHYARISSFKYLPVHVIEIKQFIVFEKTHSSANAAICNFLIFCNNTNLQDFQLKKSNPEHTVIDTVDLKASSRPTLKIVIFSHYLVIFRPMAKLADDMSDDDT